MPVDGATISRRPGSSRRPRGAPPPQQRFIGRSHTIGDGQLAFQSLMDAPRRPPAVICGTDARYRTDAATIVEAARAAGIEQIYLAGPEEAVADAPAGRPTRSCTT